MRVVILAGGLGMRLRPYTAILPKPLLPLGERPVIEHILRRLQAAGATRVDLCVAHLGELIRAYLSEATQLGEELDLRWHWEDEPLGTAGALRLIDDLDGTFLVMNGDILTTLDFAALLDSHRRSGALLTIAMHEKRVDIEFGVIESHDGLLTGYEEKPSLRYDVSMGIYVYERAALDYLPDGACQFPDLVTRLLDAGQRVAAFRTDADWFDIGTFPEYERAVNHLERHPTALGERATENPPIRP
jgi:NDP-sugar pyrophosphorylase family protein